MRCFGRLLVDLFPESFVGRFSIFPAFCVLCLLATEVDDFRAFFCSFVSLASPFLCLCFRSFVSMISSRPSQAITLKRMNLGTLTMAATSNVTMVATAHASEYTTTTSVFFSISSSVEMAKYQLLRQYQFK